MDTTKLLKTLNKVTSVELVIRLNDMSCDDYYDLKHFLQ